MTPEGRIKALVKRRVAARFPGSYRFMPVQNGMGAPGLDFFYCIGGLFIAIETKAPGGVPTPRQKKTMEQIIIAEGWCFVIDSEKSLEAALDRIERCLS